MSTDCSQVPECMQERKQWICWNTQMRDGKKTKVPIIPFKESYAKVDDSTTWRHFHQAVQAVDKASAEGIGFVFTDSDDFIGIDLDNCRDPERCTWKDWALDIIQEFAGSYVEISPSGTGAHIITKGSIPDGRNRMGDIEIYGSNRFFTVTGNTVDQSVEELEYEQSAIDYVYDEYLSPVKQHNNIEVNIDLDPERLENIDTDHSSVDPQPTELPEDEHQRIKKASNASNAETFIDLFMGRWRGQYESQSEADLALCNILAFWLEKDADAIDRAFRVSGLMRKKWDEVHYSDGSTYGEKTIQRAINRVDKTYDPSY